METFRETFRTIDKTLSGLVHEIVLDEKNMGKSTKVDDNCRGFIYVSVRHENASENDGYQ